MTPKQRYDLKRKGLRAATSFYVHELEALLTAITAIEHGDKDKARLYASSPQALRARRKLVAMRDRLRQGLGNDGHTRPTANLEQHPEERAEPQRLRKRA